MARQVNERPGGDRTACLAVLLLHLPARTWRSFGRARCGYCGGQWETGGQLVGCAEVQRASAELAALNLPRVGRYERWWMR